MLLYFFFYILLIFALAEFTKKNKSKSKGDVFLIYVVIVVSLILYDGLKNYYLFSDQRDYEYNLLYLDFDVGRNNIGFQLLNIIVHYFYNNYVFLSTLVASFVIGSYSIIIAKYSSYKWVGLFIFFITNYIMAMLAIRQYIAMAICIWAVKFIIERKQLQFLILIVLAFSFHSCAVIYLPIYYMYGLEFTKRNTILLIICVVSSILGFQLLANYVISYIAGDYAFYLDNYESEGGIMSWDRALSKLFILLLYCLVLKKNMISKGINTLVLCNMLLCFIICAGGVGLFGMFRLKEFFVLGDVLGIPLIIQYSKKSSKTIKLVATIGVIVYVTLLIISFWGIYRTNFVNGYKFFWEI